MCGIAGIIGRGWQHDDIHRMIGVQHHRGPDGSGVYFDPQRLAALGHNRLSIIDLSEGGQQPMSSADGTHIAVFNGEIYNYLELKHELAAGYDFRTRSDTEVLIAAYQKWGNGCLDHLIGMFSFLIWDEKNKTAFAARDRFGVKPFYYHVKPDGSLVFASEIKTIHAAGVERAANEKAWASYLTFGLYDHSAETFWKDVFSLPAGHALICRNGKSGVFQWYDIAEATGEEYDRRPTAEVEAEYFALIKESVKLRFRSDVPVGINLSGGLDSSTLLGLVHAVQGNDSSVKAYTFVTGAPDYDELPWVRRMVADTNHALSVAELSPDDVPSLAADVQYYQDEPFGGLPTLAYAKLFDTARADGTIVLLDGNGMDEQWAGYDYYASTSNDRQPSLVQGTDQSPVRPECLSADFRAQAASLALSQAFTDKLRNLQYRDARLTKIPRAMRFNDRISMRASTELREPFLDHRLFELALRQPPERKIENGTRKKMLRDIAARFVPRELSDSPKRPMQTPQREWLRGPLREWADNRIAEALSAYGGSWLDRKSVNREWQNFLDGGSDNSFYIWQWISIGLMTGAVVDAPRKLRKRRDASITV